MYVCVYVLHYVPVCVRMCACVRMCVSAYACFWASVCASVRVCVHVCVCLCVLGLVCVHVCARTFACVCVKPLYNPRVNKSRRLSLRVCAKLLSKQSSSAAAATRNCATRDICFCAITATTLPPLPPQLSTGRQIYTSSLVVHLPPPLLLLLPLCT